MCAYVCGWVHRCGGVDKMSSILFWSLFVLKTVSMKRLGVVAGGENQPLITCSSIVFIINTPQQAKGSRNPEPATFIHNKSLRCPQLWNSLDGSHEPLSSYGMVSCCPGEFHSSFFSFHCLLSIHFFLSLFFIG